MILATTNTYFRWRKSNFEESTEILKNAGYDAIDMSLSSMVNEDHPFMQEDYRTRAIEVRAHAEKLGIWFNQSHPPYHFNWKNPNEIEERVIPLTARALEVSALLGCKYAIVHPIHFSEYLGHEEEQFETNMKFYRALLPYAKELDIKIALENMWQNERKRKCPGKDVCSHAEEFVRYLDTLNDEHFVACLDVGHCGLAGQEAQDAIRILGHDRLKSLHVHDNNYRADQHTLPGIGEMNWEEIMKALADIKYDGEFTFEADSFLIHMPQDFVSTAIRFMEKMGRYLIGRFEYYRSQQ